MVKKLTDFLFLKDSYLKEFEAVVETVTDNKFVVLNKCAFYPQGGGQPSDTGFLEKDGEKMPVVFAKKLGQDISLEVENCSLKKGDVVNGTIDWDKRYKFMKMHSLSHVLSSVILSETGALITGNQLGFDKSRMDFNVENFDRALLESFEQKTNEAIKKNAEIKIYFKKAEEVFKDEKLFRLKSVLPPSLKELRIVEITGIDIQADGGTHVKNTSEIGIVKITKLENKGKNNRRIYFEIVD